MDSQTSTRPIFIGGLDRCGKTTLRAFLVSHPNISIPAVGSNMWTYFYSQFGDLGKSQNLDRCLAAMLRYKHVRFLKPDAERIRLEFKKGAPTYGRLFGIFLKQFAEREGKPRWGEQTGLIERYAGIVLQAYPNGRMLHMIRDPRDRYLASLKLWPGGKGRAGGATARWLYSIALAKRNLAKFSGKYRLVRFEDLVRDPGATLQAVCSFIDEEYRPEMLSMSGAPEHRTKLELAMGNEQRLPPLSPNQIGLYRMELPAPELAFMQSIAGASLRAFGYEVEPVHFSLLSRLAYTFWHWPVNFVRFLAWLGIEFFQQNYPRAFGRKPATNRVIHDAVPGT